MAKGKKIKTFLKVVLWLLLFFIVFSITPVIIFKFLPPPVTPLMFLRACDNKNDGDSVRFSYQWVSIKQMSPYLYQAAVAAEDDHFMTHHGFDFDALMQAYDANQKNETKIKGGSTISQQTAKNVFLWPRRDYIRKGLEAWFTLLIEFVWGKERIMETYLNVVELGDGIYGVEAAAQKYYHKPAANLTKIEAASLIAVLPNPHIYKVLKPSNYTQQYKWAIYTRMDMLPAVKFSK